MNIQDSACQYKNGKYALSDSGIELYDGYVFHIGDVSFIVTTIEFNYDNLKF